MSKMTIGYIGLGKMGQNMAARLVEKGYTVFAYDVSEEARDHARQIGVEVFSSLEILLKALPQPRIVWLMVPHEKVDSAVLEIARHLDRGDIVIDGGNSHYKDSVRRAKELARSGIKFMDVGVSGGPGGALSGSCLMIGGKKEDFKQLEALFKDLADVPTGKWYGYMGRHGAGHFVKMVHNAIEYGHMQANAEGFAILKKAKGTIFPELNLAKVADLYNHGSVIESRLMRWLKEALEEFSEELNGVSSTVGRSGEGDWAVDVAKEFGIFAPVLMSAVHVRKKSARRPSYAGKLLTAMRNRFGGHSIK